MPDRQTTPVDSPLSRCASFSLTRAAAELRRAASSACAPHGLSLREFWLLELACPVDDPESRSQGEIGALLGVDRSDMVRLVDGLESRGLIARSRDPEDRRRQLVTPTKAGIELRETLAAEVVAAEDAALPGLSAKQADRLRVLAARGPAPDFVVKPRRPRDKGEGDTHK